MKQLTRRSLLKSSAGLAAGAVLARPYLANAAAKTAVVWWAQGFRRGGHRLLKRLWAEYEKASGNTIELSIVPFAPERQKIISAVTSGDVPDLSKIIPPKFFALFAYQGKFVDVSDVVDTQKEEFTQRPRCSTAYVYDNVEKKRSYIWRTLSEPPYCQITCGDLW